MSRPPASRRQRRIADVIRQELSRLLLRDLKDSRIAPLTTVTDVHVSPDYKYATVRVSALATEREQRSTLIALEHAAGHLQSKLGKALQLRHTPRLRFELDDRIAEGDHVLGLLAQLQQRRDGDTLERKAEASPAPDAKTPDAD